MTHCDSHAFSEFPSDTLQTAERIEAYISALKKVVYCSRRMCTLRNGSFSICQCAHLFDAVRDCRGVGGAGSSTSASSNRSSCWEPDQLHTLQQVCALLYKWLLEKVTMLHREKRTSGHQPFGCSGRKGGQHVVSICRTAQTLGICIRVRCHRFGKQSSHATSGLPCRLGHSQSRDFPRWHPGCMTDGGRDYF